MEKYTRRTRAVAKGNTLSRRTLHRYLVYSYSINVAVRNGRTFPFPVIYI